MLSETVHVVHEVLPLEINRGGSTGIDRHVTLIYCGIHIKIIVYSIALGSRETISQT